MAKLGEFSRPSHEDSSTSRALTGVDLPHQFGVKTEDGSLDFWNYPNGSRIVVVTDRMYVEGFESLVSGLGAVDNALSNYHKRELHKKGIIWDAIIGHPHANVNIERIPEEKFPMLEVSNYGIVASGGGVLPENPDALAKVWEIFSYGVNSHKEVGFELERARIQLGKFKDGKFTVVSPLFTTSDMKITDFFNFGSRSRASMATELAAEFPIKKGLSTSSPTEVAQAIKLYFNPLEVK